jgi:hypothetical protein
MRNSSLRTLFAIFSLTFGLCSYSRAGFVTGDPTTSTGNWSFSGNSLAKGTYAGGSANFSFDLYRGSTTVSILDELHTMAHWAVGDLVIGMGGVITPTGPTGWPGATTGPSPNANLGDNTRIISKFGSPTATFGPSTTPPIPGNGQSSFSGGHAGLGGVLLSTLSGTLAAANFANAGLLQVPDAGFIWDGGIASSNGIALTSTQLSNIGRYSYKTDANKFLSRWEFVLNINALSSAGFGFALPNVNASYDQALQVGSGSRTDAVSVVPVPSSLAIIFCASLIFGGSSVYRSRRTRTTAQS